jgi:hypothetical protein
MTRRESRSKPVRLLRGLWSVPGLAKSAHLTRSCGGLGGMDGVIPSSNRYAPAVHERAAEIASNQLGELSGTIQMRHGEDVWVVISEIQQSGLVRQGVLQPAQLVECKRPAPVGGLQLRLGGIRLEHPRERPDSLLVAALVE